MPATGQHRRFLSIRFPRGAALVEVAIAIPILVLMVFAILEIIDSFRYRMIAADAARYSARLGALRCFAKPAGCDSIGKYRSTSGTTCLAQYRDCVAKAGCRQLMMQFCALMRENSAKVSQEMTRWKVYGYLRCQNPMQCFDHSFYPAITTVWRIGDEFTFKNPQAADAFPLPLSCSDPVSCECVVKDPSGNCKDECNANINIPTATQWAADTPSCNNEIDQSAVETCAQELGNIACPAFGADTEGY